MYPSIHSSLSSNFCGDGAIPLTISMVVNSKRLLEFDLPQPCLCCLVSIGKASILGFYKHDINLDVDSILLGFTSPETSRFW